MYIIMSKATFSNYDIIKITKALQGDSDALKIFLNSFEDNNENNVENNNEILEPNSLDDINDALKNQDFDEEYELSLHNQDIMLSDKICNSITDITIKQNFTNYGLFKYYKFVKLQRLTIEEDNKTKCIELLNNIFNDTSAYLSLFQINFLNQIYQEYIEIIQKYFIKNMTYVRCRTQISGKYDCYAIFINISLEIPKKTYFSHTRQQLKEIYLNNFEEKYIHYKTQNNYTVKYRNGESTIENIPIIFTTNIDYFT